MKLLVGLGNPGTEYHLTRHNAGFIFIDGIREALCHDSLYLVGEWQTKEKFHAEVCEVRANNRLAALLVKPLTYMNNSGLAVRTIIDFYKKEIQVETDLLVALDDLDLKVGTFKLERLKYPRTHKGIISIHNHLHMLEYLKLRLGVDNRLPENRIPGEEYVLQKFSQEELPVLVHDAIVPSIGRVREALKF